VTYVGKLEEISIAELARLTYLGEREVEDDMGAVLQQRDDSAPETGGRTRRPRRPPVLLQVHLLLGITILILFLTVLRIRDPNLLHGPPSPSMSMDPAPLSTDRAPPFTDLGAPQVSCPKNLILEHC